MVWLVLSGRSSAAMGTIEEGERFSRLEDGSLLIKSVEREDSGQYSCRASNSEGETAITAKLEIKGILHTRWESRVLIFPLLMYSLLSTLMFS